MANEKQPILVIMLPTGAVDLFSYPPEQLSDGCPTFEEIKRRLGFPDDYLLEPLRVRYNGKACWMLMDEEGLMHQWPTNKRATIIAGRKIVGPVAIWTGEMR